MDGSLLGAALAVIFAVAIGSLWWIGPDSTITGDILGGSFRSPDRYAFPTYCHGWEDTVVSCFVTNATLKPFQCRSYYWVPVKASSVPCCRDYIDCARSGEFRFKSFCDRDRHTCQTR